MASEWWFEGAKPRRSVNEAIFQTIGVLKLTEMLCWRPAARANCRRKAASRRLILHFTFSILHFKDRNPFGFGADFRAACAAGNHMPPHYQSPKRGVRPTFSTGFAHRDKHFSQCLRAI
jgi:hypothetical protein